MEMKRTHTIVSGIAVAVGLALGSAIATAHPGQMGAGMGQGTQGGMQHGAQAGQGHGGMQHGMKGGMQRGAQASQGHGGMKGGMGHGARGQGGAGPQAAQQLMTPEERAALREKMRNAATPEERQQIASATRTEMQKRAQERGITLPEHRGPHGRGAAAAAPQAPASAEHQH
jgi:hypothetical protein